MLDQAHKLRQLVEDKNEENLTTKIITVTSGKGGVGKSNFVVNLAIELSRLGKKVLIFDADIGMANDDVLMGFLPKYNIYDIIRRNKKIADVMISGPYGVKLIAGGSGLAKIDELTEVQRTDFLKELTSLEDFDFIIMDTGAGINRSVMGFIACCDDLIVITTPEPTSLTDSYSLLKAVNHFNIKHTAKVVINRTIDDKEGFATYSKFKNAVVTFLKMEVDYIGSLTDDRKVIQAVREQKPFVIKYPNCEASQDINRIALKIIGEKNTEISTNVQGLFKKLFNIFS